MAKKSFLDFVRENASMGAVGAGNIGATPAANPSMRRRPQQSIFVTADVGKPEESPEERAAREKRDSTNRFHRDLKKALKQD